MELIEKSSTHFYTETKENHFIILRFRCFGVHRIKNFIDKTKDGSFKQNHFVLTKLSLKGKKIIAVFFILLNYSKESGTVRDEAADFYLTSTMKYVGGLVLPSVQMRRVVSQTNLTQQ